MFTRRSVASISLRLNTIASVCLSAYLGLASIYWLPLVPTGILSIVKAALAGTAVMLYVNHAAMQKRVAMPSGLAGWSGLLTLVIAAGPAMFQSEPNQAIARLFDIVLGFVMLWTCYGLVRAKGNWTLILAPASAIVVTAALATIIAFYAPSSVWTAPPEFGSGSATDIGFGGGRTGWSNGIALHLPVLVGSAAIGIHGRIRRFATISVCAGIIIASQAVTGGRAGLLASLVGLTFIGIRAIGLRGATMVFISILLATYSVRGFLYDRLRFERLAGGMTFENLNRFSAGRLGINMQAWDLFAENPFVGHGFSQYSLIGFEGTEIHNLWLRLSVEGGFLLPLAFAVIVISLVWKTIASGGSDCADRGWRHSVGRSALGGVLCAGLTVSMFEPNVLLGTFQNSAVWWAAAGASMAHIRSDNHLVSGRTGRIRVQFTRGNGWVSIVHAQTGELANDLRW